MADKDAIHLLLSLLLPAAAPARIPLVSSTGSGTDGNGRRCDTEEDDARRWQWWWWMGSVSCDEIHAGKLLRTAVDAAGDESVSLQSQGRSGSRRGEIVMGDALGMGRKPRARWRLAAGVEPPPGLDENPIEARAGPEIVLQGGSNTRSGEDPEFLLHTCRALAQSAPPGLPLAPFPPLLECDGGGGQTCVS